MLIILPHKKNPTGLTNIHFTTEMCNRINFDYDYDYNIKKLKGNRLPLLHPAAFH